MFCLSHVLSGTVDSYGWNTNLCNAALTRDGWYIFFNNIKVLFAISIILVSNVFADSYDPGLHIKLKTKT